ncbi:MAG: hypothetical protein ACI3V0_08095 [Faecousia sp.]
MSLPSTPAGKLKPRDLALLALLAAMMVASQVALAVIPNVHLVGVLVILTTRIFGWKALYAVFSFAFLEMLIYGAGIWVINYFYVWPLMVVCAVPFRKVDSPLFWGIFAALQGLSFGALCSIPYFFVGGWAAGFSYWIAGIPFDLVHGVSNFVLASLLVRPLYALCKKWKDAP